MRTTTILLGCALVAICLTYLPTIECQTASSSTTTTTTAATDTATTTTAASDTATTTASSSDTTSTTSSSSSSGSKKTRRKHKWKAVRKPGKKVIKRHRKGGRKIEEFIF
ncbi:hypothetical protein KR215_007886 [Drosophila sulfurigaster]|nr:hypothetical protein KR215_007883 [Drosophila sulfurigaster]KAH8394309.1 hypothetical protein KR215_007884 [Drosophila sulfurigaster]KAH8394311.1 hypothetical protein KR215_007886 [Drosophila sulfurigaster]